jgi:hypothetical protein
MSGEKSEIWARGSALSLFHQAPIHSGRISIRQHFIQAAIHSDNPIKDYQDLQTTKALTLSDFGNLTNRSISMIIGGFDSDHILPEIPWTNISCLNISQIRISTKHSSNFVISSHFTSFHLTFSSHMISYQRLDKSHSYHKCSFDSVLSSFPCPSSHSSHSAHSSRSSSSFNDFSYHHIFPSVRFGNNILSQISKQDHADILQLVIKIESRNAMRIHVSNI